MKYFFITILHGLELEHKKNKGIKLHNNARVSNGKEILKEVFDNDLSKSTLGSHSIDEFDGTTYCYLRGEDENIKTFEDANNFSNENQFGFLRYAQHLTYNLWLKKDHSIYVRDGFLFVYNDEISDGWTYKASVSAVISRANGEVKGNTIFSDDDIKDASDASLFIMNSYKDTEDKGKMPTSNILYKDYSSSRFTRAYYFVLNARGTSIAPMKIVFYCNALEALFTTDNSEVVHKISERAALLMGQNSKERKEIFKDIKHAYNIRSKIVHGESVKSKDVGGVCEQLDIYLRVIFNEYEDTFDKSDNELNEFYKNLLFD